MLFHVFTYYYLNHHTNSHVCHQPRSIPGRMLRHKIAPLVKSTQVPPFPTTSISHSSFEQICSVNNLHFILRVIPHRSSIMWRFFFLEEMVPFLSQLNENPQVEKGKISLNKLKNSLCLLTSATFKRKGEICAKCGDSW